jgi:hypothetical protein
MKCHRVFKFLHELYAYTFTLTCVRLMRARLDCIIFAPIVIRLHLVFCHLCIHSNAIFRCCFVLRISLLLFHTFNLFFCGFNFTMSPNQSILASTRSQLQFTQSVNILSRHTRYSTRTCRKWRKKSAFLFVVLRI